MKFGEEKTMSLNTYLNKNFLIIIELLLLKMSQLFIPRNIQEALDDLNRKIVTDWFELPLIEINLLFI